MRKELPRYHIDEEVELDELDELETAVGSENGDGSGFISEEEEEVPDDIPKWSHDVEEGPPKLDEKELEKVDGVSRQKEIERLTEMKVLKEMPEGKVLAKLDILMLICYGFKGLKKEDCKELSKQLQWLFWLALVKLMKKEAKEVQMKTKEQVITAAVLLKGRFRAKAEGRRKEREEKMSATREGTKVLNFAESGDMTEEEYVAELKRQIRDESRSIESTTILEEWLKKVALEKYEDPKKILQVVKELNKHRQDEATPPEKAKQASDDEAASDPTSSSEDSEEDKDKESQPSKPEATVEEKKEELRKILQTRTDKMVAEQMQEEEEDPQMMQAKFTEQRETIGDFEKAMWRAWYDVDEMADAQEATYDQTQPDDIDDTTWERMTLAERRMALEAQGRELLGQSERQAYYEYVQESQRRADEVQVNQEPEGGARRRNRGRNMEREERGGNAERDYESYVDPGTPDSTEERTQGPRGYLY
ncbi:unnamed protein product [Symbiodinium microadriaticum]|nr:unnamed protein product [Symbiodinium sp. KB8]CAE7238758.1 unnamed protein product [Symbiodinium microadriaticum]